MPCDGLLSDIYNHKVVGFLVCGLYPVNQVPLLLHPFFVLPLGHYVIMLLLIYLSYITHNTEKPTMIHTDRPADVEEAGTLSELCPEGHVSSSPGFVPETELDPRQRGDRESL